MNDKIVILAAGNSSRLGKNKQLLTIKGVSLVNRSIKICQNSRLGSILLVVGSQAEKLVEQLDHRVEIVTNKDWQNGMGSSIAACIKQIESDVTGVYIVLPDQIHMSEEILLTINRKKVENPSSIIASRYQDNFGAPSYFPAEYFDALRECVGLKGAKQVLKENITEVKFIDFPQGEIDIDKPEDLGLVD